MQLTTKFLLCLVCMDCVDSCQSFNLEWNISWDCPPAITPFWSDSQYMFPNRKLSQLVSTEVYHHSIHHHSGTPLLLHYFGETHHHRCRLPLTLLLFYCSRPHHWEWSSCFQISIEENVVEWFFSQVHCLDLVRSSWAGSQAARLPPSTSALPYTVPWFLLLWEGHIHSDVCNKIISQNWWWCSNACRCLKHCILHAWMQFVLLLKEEKIKELRRAELKWKVAAWLHA